MVLTASAVALEFPYHVGKEADVSDTRTWYVIGDSISSGLSTNEVTWPIILRQRYALDITNLAEPGAQVDGAVDQAREVAGTNVAVLVEIGGNDLLGSSGSRHYRRHLDELLGIVCKPDRTVLMFELPLPPLCNGYGHAQRELARKHGAVLVPKRLVARVLRARNTTDGLHLSAEGHRQFADLVADRLTGLPAPR
jgi:acyl-CoA thioesterase-1